MEVKRRLYEQIKVVITKLEKYYRNEINCGTLQLIYKRYRRALDILENNKDIAGITIICGVRAYLDSYSDYQNSILRELHKAEELYKQLKYILDK